MSCHGANAALLSLTGMVYAGGLQFSSYWRLGSEEYGKQGRAAGMIETAALSADDLGGDRDEIALWHRKSGQAICHEKQA